MLERMIIINDLKFRAWHKQREKYYQVATIDVYEEVVGIVLSLSGTPSYEPIIGYMNTKTYVEVEYLPFEDVIIEEYIGDDEDGLEIYEGDIVVVTYYNHVEPINERYETVEYDKYSYRYDIGNVYENAQYISINKVGNIHENKELLNNELR